MIKKTIKYHDYEGNEREDDFYFHLNQVEMTKINGEVPGGLDAYIEMISKNNDRVALLKVIDLLVSRAYGEKTIDGRNGFIKHTPDGLPLYEFFVNTEAYDNLLTELIKSADNVMDFLTGCMTKDVQDKVKPEWERRKAEFAETNLTPITAEGTVK